MAYKLCMFIQNWLPTVTDYNTYNYCTHEYNIIYLSQMNKILEEKNVQKKRTNKNI